MMEARESSPYGWRNDLIDRGSLTLIGPQGWLAHLMRGDDATWSAVAATGGGDLVVAGEPDLQLAMSTVYEQLVECAWVTQCDLERAPGSRYCPVHESTGAAAASRLQ